MNEWQLQDLLTKQWIEDQPSINGQKYELIAWELMFPSWGINNKNLKWNEVSVDFILYNQSTDFLCLELKNEIKGPKQLLSAYCQVLHRSHLFRKQFKPDKMSAAYRTCFTVGSYRITEVESNMKPFEFPIHPIVQPILAARKFPNNAQQLMDEWKSMSDSEFLALIADSSKIKEFKRMIEEDVKRQNVSLLLV